MAGSGSRGAARRAVAGLLLAGLALVAAGGAGGAENAASSEGLVGAELDLLTAVQRTLALDPNLELGRLTNEGYAGALQAQEGAFDLTLGASASAQRTYTPYTTAERTTADLTDAMLKYIETTQTQTLSLSRKLRTGTTLAPTATYTRSDVLADLNRPSYTGAVSFVITQPLLRGRGTDYNTAGLRQAALQLQAGECDLRQTAADRVAAAVRAYWTCLSAKQKVAVRTESEQRTRKMVEVAEALIAADELPASERDSIRGALGDRTAARVAAEQSFFEARQALGLAMGLPLADIIRLPIPADLFPQLDAARLPRAEDDQRYVALAVGRRPDLRSLDLARQVAEVQLAAARHELQPALTLTLSGGYSGKETQEYLGDGHDAFRENVSGVNTVATVNYAWPVANNAAEGVVRQREAALAAAAVNRRERERQAASEVLVACAALRAAHAGLAQTRESVDSYRRALANEEEKRRLGMSTQFNVMQMEDLLVEAMSSEVDAVLGCAAAVLRLRAATGTLVRDGADGAATVSVALDDLLTIPQLD